jgi:hypothetical protein
MFVLLFALAAQGRTVRTVTMTAPEGKRSVEVELSVTAKKAVLLLHDPRTNLAWWREYENVDAITLKRLEQNLRQFSFATDGRTIVGFQLSSAKVLIWPIRAGAKSLADARKLVRPDPTPGASFDVLKVFQWTEVDADDVQPGSNRGVTIASVRSDRGRWVVVLRNHRGVERAVVVNTD